MEEMQEYHTKTSESNVAIEMSNLTAMWDVVEKTNVSSAADCATSFVLSVVEWIERLLLQR